MTKKELKPNVMTTVITQPNPAQSNLTQPMITILTAVVNNPIFIEIQHHTLKKHFKGDDYEFIVFNDAKDFPDFTNGNDVTVKRQIQDTCRALNIACINVPNEGHKTNRDAAIRCADSMNYLLQYQKTNPGKYLCLDSDMFLADDFDVTKYAGYDCAVVLQSRVLNPPSMGKGMGQPLRKAHYFWNGVYYFDTTKMRDIELLNWNCCPCCDVGGMMQEWLRVQMARDNAPMPNTDEIRWTNKQFHTPSVYFMKHLWSVSWDLKELPPRLKQNQKLVEFFQKDQRNVNGKFFCEIYDDVFLHYRAGGNWRNEGASFHSRLSRSLKQCLE